MVKTQLLHACGLLGLVLCSSGLAPEVHEVSMLRLNNIEFEVGEQVRIREGSFENFEGSVEELQPEKGMVKVSIMVFGRPTPIDFECWKVEKVED